MEAELSATIRRYEGMLRSMQFSDGGAKIRAHLSKQRRLLDSLSAGVQGTSHALLYDMLLHVLFLTSKLCLKFNWF